MPIQITDEIYKFYNLYFLNNNKFLKSFENNSLSLLDFVNIFL